MVAFTLALKAGSVHERGEHVRFAEVLRVPKEHERALLVTAVELVYPDAHVTAHADPDARLVPHVVTFTLGLNAGSGHERGTHVTFADVLSVPREHDRTLLFAVPDGAA